MKIINKLKDLIKKPVDDMVGLEDITIKIPTDWSHLYIKGNELILERPGDTEPYFIEKLPKPVFNWRIKYPRFLTGITLEDIR
jgi:hypothetical protein